MAKCAHCGHDRKEHSKHGEGCMHGFGCHVISPCNCPKTFKYGCDTQASQLIKQRENNIKKVAKGEISLYRNY